MIRTEKEIEQIVNNLGYKLLRDYMSEKKHRRVLIQDEIGYEYDIVFNSLYRGCIPTIVDRGRPIQSLKNIVLWLSINTPDLKLCKDNLYEGTDRKLKFYHIKCQEYFYMAWNNIRSGQGCSVCAGKQIGKYNNLAYLRPNLAKEWHPCNEKSPDEVLCNSGKRVYWICTKCNYGKNKEWFTSPDIRESNGCPACAGKVVTDKNRLSIRFPEIAKEWDYSKNKNTPYDVSYGTPRKVWWICPNNHSYYSSINSRTYQGNSCRQCADKQKESLIATELKDWAKRKFKKYFHKEYQILRNPETNAWLWYDIYIGLEDSIDGVYIEIHGKQHYIFHSRYHKTQKDFEDSKYRDKLKKNFAKKNGKYIEIDLRKIKTVDEAIKYIENILRKAI